MTRTLREIYDKISESWLKLDKLLHEMKQLHREFFNTAAELYVFVDRKAEEESRKQ